jgi:hypothetical protein
MADPDALEPGVHYFKVVVCHGCQTCWVLDEDGSVSKAPNHILRQVEVTPHVNDMRSKLGLDKELF